MEWDNAWRVNGWVGIEFRARLNIYLMTNLVNRWFKEEYCFKVSILIPIGIGVECSECRNYEIGCIKVSRDRGRV